MTTVEIDINIRRGQELVMCEALANFPVIDKDAAEKDLDRLKQRAQKKGVKLNGSLDRLATRVRDGNPIYSAVAINDLHEALKTTSSTLPRRATVCTMTESLGRIGIDSREFSAMTGRGAPDLTR
jgi:hypothetical protein